MYVSIDNNQIFTFADVRSIVKPVQRYRDRLRAKGMAEVTLPFKRYGTDAAYCFPPLSGVEVELAIPIADYEVDEETGLPYYVRFKWRTADGYSLDKLIELEVRPNNLGEGYVGYFVCPDTHNICRKLYTDGYSLHSRHYLLKQRRGFRYLSQGLSHRQREAQRMHRAAAKAEEARAHRNIYGGKPTIWARRIEMYEGKEDAASANVIVGMAEVLCRLLRK